MKRSHLSGVLLGMMLAALLAQTALADRPARDPAPPPPGTVIPLTSGECPFPVDLLVLANKEYTLTFASGAQIVTGQLSVRATNITTGSSVDVNVSGPLFTRSAARHSCSREPRSCSCRPRRLAPVHRASSG